MDASKAFWTWFLDKYPDGCDDSPKELAWAAWQASKEGVVDKVVRRCRIETKGAIIYDKNMSLEDE